MLATIKVKEATIPGREKTENNLFPVFLKFDILNVLIVGGGKLAHEKLEAIIRNTERRNVQMVATDFSREIIQLTNNTTGVILYEKIFEPSDLDNTDIVICAVDDPIVSKAITTEARLRGVLINVADKPDQGDFYLGAMFTKGHLKIAISTNGKSPTIAKRVKEILQEAIPPEIDFLSDPDQINIQSAPLKDDFNIKVARLNYIPQDLLKNEKKSVSYWNKLARRFVWAFIFLFLGFFFSSIISFEYLRSTVTETVVHLGPEFYLMVITGFVAQLIDGALGMGYGVTCTSVLLGAGIPLPAISGSIHAAEMFSSGISGFTHYKFGNVNKKLFKVLLIPGILGSILGAILLSYYGTKYADYVKPILALYTMFLGIKILLKAFKKARKRKNKNVGWLAGAGGFLDSFGGGGWGPLVTSTLISGGRSPKYVIGTVSMTEFFVTLASAVTFFSLIGISHWKVIFGLVLGGTIAAPLAAKLVGRLPQKISLLLLGVFIIIWSTILIVNFL